MKNVLLINGPNLNLIGKREINIYGNISINDIKNECVEKGKKLKILFEYNSGTNNFFLKQGGIKKMLRFIDKSDTL